MSKPTIPDDSNGTFHDQMLGKLALNYKLVTSQEYVEAVNIQKKEITDGLDSTLHEVLVKHEFITKEDMALLHKAKDIITCKRKEKRFGAIAVSRGLISEAEIEEALKIQKSTAKEIGQILLGQGLLSPSQCEKILEIQKKIIVQLPSLQDLKQKTPEPSLPPVQETFEVNVSEDGLTAVLVMPKSRKEVKPEDVHRLLANNDISHGVIDDNTIEENLKYKNLGLNSFIVAKGEKSITGIPGELILHFTPRELKPGELSEDGTIDFRNRGDVPFVVEEELLAERKNMLPSKPGTNVFGQMIDVDIVEDVVFISGSGTVFNEAGDKIIAEHDGEPFMNLDGSISVLREYRVDDVNYETGNINFDGNVTVRGIVNSDFKVEGTNIKAQEILSAEIIAKGDVIVEQGIIGAKIIAAGKVQATFIKDCEISCVGDVIAEKEILDSKVETLGLCCSKGSILSSSVQAACGISSVNIGSNISQPNLLEFGTTSNHRLIEELKEEKSRIEQAIAGIEDQKENTKNMVKIINNIIQEIELDHSKTIKEQDTLKKTVARIEKKSNKVVQAGRQRIKEFNQKIEAGKDTIKALTEDKKGYDTKLAETKKELGTHKEDLETVQRKLKNLTSLMNDKKGVPAIRVFDTIQEGTRVTSVNSSLTLKDSFTDVSLKEVRVSVPERPSESYHKIQITRRRG